MRRVAAHLGVAGAGAAPPNVKVDVVGLLLRLNVKDVREVLASYKQEQEATGKSVPEIFRSRQYRFQKQQRQKSAETKPAFSRGW